MTKEVLLLIACVIGYLLGSLSGGIIVSCLAKGPDLHTVGSMLLVIAFFMHNIMWYFSGMRCLFCPSGFLL